MAWTDDLKNRTKIALASPEARDELQGYLGGHGLTGNVYYYDPTSGSDDNDGKAYNRAKATLNAAIGLCTANNGDVIVNMRGTETVTETVEFDVAGITVIPQYYGVQPYVMGEFSALLADASFTSGPVATITAPCTIIGMGFVSRDAGATFYDGAACLIGGSGDANPFGVHMAHCRFPKWGLDNRIGLSVEGSSDVLIEHCGFEGVGSDFESGIYIQGATQNIEIRHCVFRDCDYALTLGAFAGGGPYLDFNHNTIVGADSKGVDSGGNTAVGIIRNNWFNTDVGASTFDGTVAALESQGLICTGNHYATEATGPT